MGQDCNQVRKDNALNTYVVIAR